MTKKKTPNKTQFIKSMPNAPAAEVVSAGKKKGMKFSDAYVYSVRSSVRSKRATGHPAKNPVLPGSGEQKHKKQQLVDLVLDIGLAQAQAVIDRLRAAATVEA